MKATTPLTELGQQLEASTGAATKCQSGPAAGIVGKAMAAVEFTRSFLGRASELVLEKTASAKVAAIAKCPKARLHTVTLKPGEIGIHSDDWDHGFVTEIDADSQGSRTGVEIGMIFKAIDGQEYCEDLLDAKLEGSEDFEVTFEVTAFSQVKKIVIDQVTSVNLKAFAVLDAAKARVVKVGSTIQQSGLDYMPAGVKAQIVLVLGYATEKLFVVKGTAASLKESTRERVLAQVTSAQILTMNTIEVAKTQAAYLGDVVVENTPIQVKSGVTTAYKSAATQASAAQQTIASVSDKAVAFSKAKASEVNTAVREVASDPKAQTAAIGAAGGAVTLGATGGAVGLVSGSMAGAMVGLVPAIFTFGLSIPIGAVLGGGAGLCVGTAVGGTTGLVAGGAAGYKKDSIASGSKIALAQAGDCAQYAKEKATASLQFVQEQANSVRARGRANTGGTVGSESD